MLSRSPVSRNPGTATFLGSISSQVSVLAAFVSISASRLGTALFTACCWAAAGQSLLLPGRLAFQLVCVSIKARKNISFHLTGCKFCVSGSISLSTFSQLMRICKTGLFDVARLPGGKKKKKNQITKVISETTSDIRILFRHKDALLMRLALYSFLLAE